MELIMEQCDSFDEENEGNLEQLQKWIADNWDAIHAMYTLMQISPSYDDYHHTYADFSKYGGNSGVIIDLLINDDKKLEMTVYDENGDEYTEVLEVVI